MYANQQDNSLECRFVGAGNIHSARLELLPSGVTGRILGLDASYPVSIEQKANQVQAKIGLEAEAQETVLEYSGAFSWELLVGVLLADISSRNAWRALLDSYQGSAEG